MAQLLLESIRALCPRPMPIEALPVFRNAVIDDTRRAVALSYGLRMLALALGGITVSTVLYLRGVPVSVWILVASYVLVWPHVAWLISRRSPEPIATGRRCFMGDFAMTGVWIALMQFNLLPSVLLATMVTMTLIAMEGRKLLARAVFLLALACCIAAMANGFAFAPDTSMPEVLASLPLLVVLPVAQAFMTYGLARRVRSQNRKLFRLGSLDSLSGLLNRGHWEEAVNAALNRRSGDDAVLMLIDIDHFKHVNDQYGHTLGDEVVRKVGAIIRSGLRDNDIAGRYGGDEFGVVLNGVNIMLAAAVAERIRSGLACSLFERAPRMRCTLSIGLASRPAIPGAASDWIKEADAALYRAKLAGRNRLAMAT